MNRSIVIAILLLCGCAGPAPAGYNSDDGTGAIVWNEYDYPACSDVTISMRRRSNHSPNCQIR